MLDGLDEAVTGLKAGESKTFTSTLVGGDFRGQEADITVTVAKVVLTSWVNSSRTSLGAVFAVLASAGETDFSTV